MSTELGMTGRKVVDAYIRNHLIEYCGKIQIAQMGEEKWKEYPLWRKRTETS
jgi:hypothetical protein